MTALEKLVKEYRPSMDAEVLHSWATEVVSTLHGQQAGAVAEQWRALENSEPSTSWRYPECGDLAGWQAIANRRPDKYAIERRPLYTHPLPTEMAPVAVKDALGCVVHALMVLPVPIDGQGKRAWSSLLEAQKILESAITPAAKPAVGVVEALADLVNSLDVDSPIYDADDGDMPVMTAARAALGANATLRARSATDGVKPSTSHEYTMRRIYKDLVEEGGGTWATYMMSDIEAAIASAKGIDTDGEAGS